MILREEIGEKRGKGSRPSSLAHALVLSRAVGGVGREEEEGGGK